jgi:predicted GIY-YIG superfamily endonuclease
MKMNVKFKKLAEQMPGLLQNLEFQPPRTRGNLAGIPKRGVYVFYENNKALYVGRSDGLKKRIQQHGRPSATHNSATFAFNLAKEEMAPYRDIRKYPTRKALQQASGFKGAFSEAKNRVAEMKIRVIQIDDPFTQALFEIYAVLTLDTTRYNDFSTH